MPNSHIAATVGRASMARRALVAIAALAVVAGAFVSGAYAGRWAVKNQLSARVRSYVSALFHMTPSEPNYAEVGSDWTSKATHLYRIETSSIHLPGTAEGWGGGLVPMTDGRILYATRVGDFGILGNDGVARVQPFSVDMNLPALKAHPVMGLSNFNPMWFRVTDIDLAPLANGRHELIVGHHYFDAERQCVELRLSRAELAESDGGLKLVRPFETLLRTTPCITFYHPGYEFAFEGHFSGGRIARFGEGQVLFSTGDHGWVGLRGYPAVSNDDTSTLGKILLVDLKTKEVLVYAKGVRNPQGLHVDSSGRIWETEHGPRGGDELNLIERGRDYGWPASTYGTDYGPRPWPHSAHQGRYEAGVPPRFSWVPSIGVSNLIELRGDGFPEWKGDLLVLSLAGQTLHRVRLDGDRVVYVEPIRFEGFRLRDLAELPDGRLVLLTDSGTVIFVRNGDRPGASPYLDASRRQPRTVDLSVAEQRQAIEGRYARAQAGAAPSADDVAHAAAPGRQVFQRECASCHPLTADVAGVGPSLHGVVGRPVGTSKFAYSEALAGGRADRWTGRRIVEFASDPGRMYAGSVMPPVQLSPSQREELERFFGSP